MNKLPTELLESHEMMQYADGYNTAVEKANIIIADLEKRIDNTLLALERYRRYDSCKDTDGHN
jgi:hypothetical protein